MSWAREPQGSQERICLYIMQHWGSKAQEQERGCWSPGCLAKGEGRGKL